MHDAQETDAGSAGEAARLQALASYEVLDTPPDEHFDALVKLAARLCHCPMALITLLDDRRQWFKAAVGVKLHETPRQIAFCAHTIAGDGIFQTPDALADSRFATNPLVQNDPHLRFYAGVPLQVEGGHKLGALSVLDRVPRRLTPQEEDDLRALARQVVLALEERRLRIRAERASAQARRQSESLLAIAGRVARLGAWEFEIEPEKIVWSDVVADIHGMPRGFSPDLHSALSFYLEPHRSMLAEAVDECVQHGTPFDFEMVLQPAAGGPTRWVRSIGEAVRARDGHITHLRGACQDITERKSHEVERQRLADRLVATLESIPDPFLAVRLDGTIEHANAALVRLAERSRAELISAPLSSVLPEGALAPALEARCQEALANQIPVEFEAVDARGERRFEVRIFPIEDGLTIHARDITQREQALARLRLLDACVRCLNDAVVITDTNLEAPGPTIVFANQATQTLCGWEPHELVGGSPRRLQGPMTQRDRLEALREAMSVGLPFETELINYRRTGETYWVELKLSGIQDDDGKCTHFVAVERDITERKVAESHRIALEQRLLQAQKMESIGTLAGGIAHDFNNILGAILGHVVLVRDALPAGSPGLAALSTISNSAQRARSLVQQILAFASRQATHRVREPLRPLVEETVQLLRSTLTANVALRATLPEEEVLAEIDRNQLQQVLINLCTNAWHALPPTGGQIEIGLDTSAKALTPGNGDAAHLALTAHLWVKDNGCGIDAKAQARIFEPFFSTKPVGQGTGLGLSASHGIVVAHGGLLSVDSEPGVGSVFHIHLPACDAPAAAVASAKVQPLPVQLHGLRVLCVDDDPVMLMTMQALLEREGCVVQACLEAVQALEWLHRSPGAMDLLVTDFNMPGMDGLGLVQAAHGLQPSLPVVLASGFMSDSLSERARAAGVKAMMNKERAVEDLIDTVRTALSLSRAHAGVAAQSVV